ncbi:Uncharacterized protein HZ326_2207 [Fusarium oxysporum f. sp. albedinis]|nr:Uncharacterized protein HZ326_2207 [Fusarium oxysporum f. sp. albedinis]
MEAYGRTPSFFVFETDPREAESRAEARRARDELEAGGRGFNEFNSPLVQNCPLLRYGFHGQRPMALVSLLRD